MEARGRSLAALVLALLAVLLLSPPAFAQSTPITAGAGLDWGLKASWRNYIGVAGTTLSDGVTRNADGTFHFPIKSGTHDAATNTTKLTFGGKLVFLGHCENPNFGRPCALDMTLSEPRVEITEDGSFIYAKMASRPIEGGEIVDLPDVKLALIDHEAASYARTNGVVTWSNLVPRMTAEGSRVFTYSIGTVLDTASFSYSGPGGVPVAESWTPAGEATYTATALAGAQGRLTRLYPGFGEGTALAVGESWFSVVDPATLVPKAGSTVQATLIRDTVAIDPASRTVFASRSGSRELIAYTWDGTTFTGGPVANGGPPPGASTDATVQGAGVWDAAGQRYLNVRTFTGRQELWQVSKSETGEWVASLIGVIKTADGSPNGSRIASLVAVPGGFVAAVWGDGPLLELTVGDGTARVGPLAQGGSLVASELFRTAGGFYATRNAGAAYFKVTGATIADGVDVAFSGGGPFADLNRRLNWMTVDPARDVLFAGSAGNTRMTKVIAGVAEHDFAIPGSPTGLQAWDHYAAGADPAGNLLLGSSVAGRVSRLDYQGAAAAFTTQPHDTAVSLGTGDTAPVTFTVAVKGDPAPTVRWQSRIPGVSTWADVGTGLTHTATVGAADQGRQFRAIASSIRGEVASQRVNLDVKTLPSVAVAPLSTSVLLGSSALFEVLPTGNPDPEIVWQRKVGGFWEAVDPDSGDFAVDGGSLTVLDPALEMSGTQFRARLRNEVGTTYTAPVTLTVSAPAPVTFGGGTVEWGFANRWRCYVVGNVARGQIEVSGGVEKIPGTLATGSLCAGRNAGSEALRFPIKGGSVHDGKLELTLRGTVRFWGHDYHVPGNTTPQLDTRFTNLRLVVEDGAGTLIADTAGATMEHPTPVTRTNVKLVSVDFGGDAGTPVDGGLAWSGLETQLTAEGSTVFGSYPEGEPFDALSIVAKYGTPQTTPDPEPEVEATPTPVPTVVAPAPTPTPAPTVTPAASKAQVTGAKRAATLSTKRTATLATVACPKDAAGGCRVSVPKSVRVTIAGRRYTVTLSTTTRLVAGKSATVRAKLSSTAARRLRGRSVKVKVKIATTVAGQAASSTVTVTLKGRAR